ncbi:MAG: DNA-binding protein [Verrucomicrobiaceae bacterium]|nr:MAG: DNA-binding protein [Verrucomicrobiaceae bacterium]
MASVTEQDYATPADLAARYRVSKRTIHYWLERGTIAAAFRRGNVIRFIVEDVDQQLKQTEGAASGDR